MSAESEASCRTHVTAFLEAETPHHPPWKVDEVFVGGELEDAAVGNLVGGGASDLEEEREADV